MQTFNGLQYLKIDIANNFGLDKDDWEPRIQWFHDNEHKLDSLVNQAEEPALFYAGVQAYRKALNGQASGYPISLDATSSGIQILACLTGDRKAAELCNVVNVGKRMDAYTHLYGIMCEAIGDSSKIERKGVKQAVMTSFYGSTAEPRNVFGEGALLETFFETMENQAPGCWELNQTMLALWDPTALSHDWIMPDNFHVHIKIMRTISENVHFLNQPFEVQYSVNAPVEKGRSLGANLVHSIDGMVVREMSARCMFNADKVSDIRHWLNNEAKGGTCVHTEADKLVYTLAQRHHESGFLSARILDYLTLENLGHVDRDALIYLLSNLPEKPFQVLSVHDCFRCLPNHGDALRRTYNIILSDIARSDMLSFIVSQIVKRQVPVTKLDPNLWIDIADADYALS